MPAHALDPPGAEPGARGLATQVVIACAPLSPAGLMDYVAHCLGPAAADELRRLPPLRRPGHAASRVALQQARQEFEKALLVPDSETKARAHHSISHSGRMGLAAVGPVPVGADLEPEGRFSRTFISRVAELDEIRHVLAAGVPASLFPATIWTVKEAALKVTGRGLALLPRNVRINRCIEGGWHVDVTDRRHGDSDWDVTGIGLPGWRAAVARPPGAGPVRVILPPTSRQSGPSC